MSNKAITTNDLKAVLDVVLPPQPSEYRKLLWTNPSPTSSFAAQTISLDLSDYDEVEIEAKQLANGSIIQLCRVGIGKQTKCLFRDGNANNFYTRTFITSTSSVQFGDAYYNATLTNTDCVPTAIYGIKYERVAPPQVEYPTYSTAEQEVGTWVTGKPLYRKVLQYSSMPNNTTAVYAHNIANMDIVVRFSCCWWDSTDGRFLMSPRIDSSTVNVRCSINKTNIVLEAIGTNWSTRTSDVNVIVEYTKTTD